LRATWTCCLGRAALVTAPHADARGEVLELVGGRLRQAVDALPEIERSS